MRTIVIFTIAIVLSNATQAQEVNLKPRFTQAELDEFELLNLCHCHEYLKLRNYDYIKWKSEESKKKHLKEIEYTEFGQYLTPRLNGQYYQAKYDSSLFLKHGISIYYGSNLDFSRLDSLYYEPIVQHYIREQSKTENLPYLGLGDNFFFMDCFYKIKEIPLEVELEYFLMANNSSGLINNYSDIPENILSQLDKMGVDDLPVLNSHESDFLNVIYKDSSKGFDFTNKRVGFIKISGEKGKKRYFDMKKKHFADEKHPCDNGTLYIFSETQKKESGGYDAAIVYWSKFLIPIEKVVSKLKKQGPG